MKKIDEIRRKQKYQDGDIVEVKMYIQGVQHREDDGCCYYVSGLHAQYSNVMVTEEHIVKKIGTINA